MLPKRLVPKTLPGLRRCIVFALATQTPRDYLI